MTDPAGFVSLDAVLRGHEASRQQLATRLMYDAAQALSALHSAGKLHGDIRCQNILVSPDLQTVQLSGLAHSFDWNAVRFRVITSNVTASDVGVSVSPAVRWLAPECVTGGLPTPASDVYAFALTLYEALTGLAPFEANDDDAVVEMKKLKETGLPDRQPDKIGREAWSFIEDACHHNPMFRPSVQIVVMTLRSLQLSVGGSHTATYAGASTIPVVPVRSTPPVATPTHPANIPVANPPAVTTITSTPTLGASTYVHPVGHPVAMTYHYPTSSPADTVPTTGAPSHPAIKVTPYGAQPTSPANAAPPAQQPVQATPTWKKIARVVVVILIAVTIGVGVPKALVSHSSTSSSGGDDASPTPTPMSTMKPTTAPSTKSPYTDTPQPSATSPTIAPSWTPPATSPPTVTPTPTPTSTPRPIVPSKLRLASSASVPTSGPSVSTILNADYDTYISAFTVAPDGTLYVALRDEIYAYRNDGTEPQRIAGSPVVTGYATGKATDAHFHRINALVVDHNGDLLVADSGNCLLRRIDVNSASPIVVDVAGAIYEQGMADGTLWQARFTTLDNMVLDRHNNAYVLMQGDKRIRNVSMSADSVTTLPVTVEYASSLAMSPQHDELYVSSGTKLVRISADGSTTEIVAGAPGVFGYTDAIGTAAEFDWMTMVAPSPLGDELYIVDQGNNCIRRYNVTDHAVTTLAGACRQGSGYVDGDLADARFFGPWMIAVAPDGVIYVMDGSRVRRIQLKGGR